MNVTREVIVDLLPLYLAGEASPASRALVESYLKTDPELARQIRVQWAQNLKTIGGSGLPPELELRSLQRTRRLLSRQRWLFGFALFLAAFGLSFQFSTWNGHLVQWHFMFRDYPVPFGGCLFASVICWIGYFWVRLRVRRIGL